MSWIPLVAGLSVFVAAASCSAKMNPDSHVAVTNLVELLPYVQSFSSNLDLDTPRILTTNDVTKFTGYRPKIGYGRENVSIDVGKFHFTVDVENRFVCDYSDNRYALAAMRPGEMKPLNPPSFLTRQEALEMARKYLARLGYSEKDLPVFLPGVREFKWEPPGDPHAGLLLYYTVEWAWRKYPDWKYFAIEIDALRKKVTHFSTIHPRQDPPLQD